MRPWRRIGVLGGLALAGAALAAAQQAGTGRTDPVELSDRGAQDEAESPLLAGRFDEVLPGLLEQAAAHPEDASIPYKLAAVYLRAERYEEGLPHALRACELDPENIRSRWLLRVLTLLAGRDVETIPEAHRLVLPPAAPSPVKFEDATEAAGVANLSLGRGAGWGDFDRDGHEDLLVCGSRAPFRLFRNLGDGTFEDVAESVGLVDPVGLGCWAATFADYDNDGFLDIFFTGNGWGGMGRLFLFHNDEGRRFVDVTREAGLEMSVNSFGAAWADYDNDGLLDVAVSTGIALPTGGPLLLFRNRGDGTFEETGSGTGLAEHQRWINLCWGDYDADGRPDLGATSIKGGARLFRNLGQGRFEDAAPEAFFFYRNTGYSCEFLDYDNDGHLDHFVSIYGPADLAVTLEYMVADRPAPPDELQLLLRNEGDGTFTPVSAEAEMTRWIHGMASQVGDVNSDGFPDVLVGAGNPVLDYAEAQELFLNDGDGTFTPIARAAGIDDWGKLHGMAFADYDDSGHLSVYGAFGGFYWADRGQGRLFRNTGTDNHALEVHLVGTESNRDGIGTRLVAHLGERAVYRWHDGGSGFASMNTRYVHIGLGESDRVDLLEVHWPSGTSQTFREIPGDQRLELVEGSADFRTLTLLGDARER